MTLAATPTSREVCECWAEGVLVAGSLEWSTTMVQRFDSTPQALLTLFETATTEGWIDIMFAAVDAVAIDAQPRRDHAPGWILFFVFGAFPSASMLGIDLDAIPGLDDGEDAGGGAAVAGGEAAVPGGEAAVPGGGAVLDLAGVPPMRRPHRQGQVSRSQHAKNLAKRRAPPADS